MSDEPIISPPPGDQLPNPHEARSEANISRDERHHDMGNLLTSAIDQGKTQVPLAPDPLVSRPDQLESWRVFKIMSEFVEGFDVIRKYKLAATVFGTARESFNPQLYADCTELTGRLAKEGFAIITGGSAGIMQAANRGAYEVGGASLGLNIRLDDRQPTNKYVTDQMMFDHFFVRKVMLTYASEVYIYFPGGYGTLDEFTEILTLVQTKKIRRVPIVLYSKEYWDPIVEIFRTKLWKEYKAIDEGDLELFRVVDSVDEAFEYIQSSARSR